MGKTILGILGALVPLAVKIIMAYLERKEMDSVTRKKFLDFVDSMKKSMKVPSNLRKDYAKQGDRLRKRLEELKKK